MGNKFLYGEVGFRDFLGPRAAALEVQALYCDDQQVPLPPGVEGICVVNIPSFAGEGAAAVCVCFLLQQRNNTLEAKNTLLPRCCCPGIALAAAAPPPPNAQHFDWGGVFLLLSFRGRHALGRCRASAAAAPYDAAAPPGVTAAPSVAPESPPAVACLRCRWWGFLFGLLVLSRPARP